MAKLRLAASDRGSGYKVSQAKCRFFRGRKPGNELLLQADCSESQTEEDNEGLN